MMATSHVPIHEPVILADGGPWAIHDMACAVCRTEKAVIDVGTGIFHPCWNCQEDGWHLIGPARGLRRVFEFIASGGYSELRRPK